MTNVVELHPKQVCCIIGCGREATQTIRLVDFDTHQMAGRKFFCDEHGRTAGADALSSSAPATEKT